MKIFVLGGQGQLGSELCRKLGDGAVGLGRDELDITDRDKVLRAFRDWRPAAIVNTAAYTAVDKAELEPELCEAVNARGVANLADACRQADCPLVQISTDYVFGSGSPRTVPYREDEPTAPQGVYALSKLHGEQQAAGWAKPIIVRTCGLYGRVTSRNLGNFVETMLRLAASKPVLRVVDDQHCTPSYVPHVADAILFLLNTHAYGTYHVVNRGSTTWHEFACEILRQAGLKTHVEPISTAEYGAQAPRPHYSVLDCGKYLALGGPALPPWRQALAEYLAARGQP